LRSTFDTIDPSDRVVWVWYLNGTTCHQIRILDFLQEYISSLPFSEKIIYYKQRNNIKGIKEALIAKRNKRIKALTPQIVSKSDINNSNYSNLNLNYK
jgi:hypothetical protein